MEREEVRTIVKGLIAKVTDVAPEEIADDASFGTDLELDSLAMIEIAVHVEYTYKFKLTPDEMGSIRSVEDAVSMVLKKKADPSTLPAS
jgi:acyl carrier protein